MLRAQSSTEYIIVLGVVLVLLLITLSLMGFFSGFTTDTRAGESASYWANAASPFSIIDWKFTGAALSVVMQNKAPAPLALSSFTLTAGNLTYLASGLPYTFPSGGRTTLSFAVSDACQADNYYEYDAALNYSTDSVTSISWAGSKPLIVRCSG